MKLIKNLATSLTLTLLFAHSALSTPTSPDTITSGMMINGSGSSAAQPLYSLWADAYKKNPTVSINYRPIGSAGGIKQIKAREVDFGASDVALPASELALNKLVQFPSAISGVVPVINLPGLKEGELKLNGDILVGIFSLTISKWNDPAIAALNPGLILPKTDIIPIVRLDGSGTTYNFTDYLSTISPIWRTTLGTNFLIQWSKKILQVKGSSNIASTLKTTPGSISYIDYNYVVQEKLNYCQLQNSAGKFIRPNPASFTSALNNSRWKSHSDFSQTLSNKPGAASWPITMGTFIILPAIASNSSRAIASIQFFVWGFMQGDRYVNNLDLVHIPDQIQAKIFKTMTEITDQKGHPLNWSAMP